MTRLLLTLLLLFGLNLSAQEKKAYQLEDGTIRVESYYSNNQVKEISFYWENKPVGTWFKYDEQGNLIAKAEIKNGKPIKLFRYENGITTIIDRKKNSITKIKP